MIQLRLTFALGALLGVAAWAQEPAPPPPGAPGIETKIAIAGVPGAMGGDFIYLRAGMGMDKVVKGSPYSAQAVTDMTQTLADGNRIHHSTTTSIARDSEGRVRREEAITAIGPLAGAADTPKSVFIHDPVTSTSYVLEPENHVARKMNEPKSFTLGPEIAKEKADMAKLRAERAHARLHAAESKTEDLGTQIMEGVTVQGKRVTRVIPAGQIGNDREIQSVTETWYSPELQTTVMSKTDDPRTGEVTYKLTNISRAEPDPALFQVPTDYKVVDGGETFNRHVRVMLKEE